LKKRKLKKKLKRLGLDAVASDLAEIAPKENKGANKGDTGAKDIVRFGEVVSAPPSLTKLPRGASKIVDKVSGKKPASVMKWQAHMSEFGNGPSAATPGASQSSELALAFQNERMKVEREKAIQNYRKLKADRRLEARYSSIRG
jgi:hypothetical protein